MTQSTKPSLFYFCLNRPRDQNKVSWLVSGVIEALDEKTAREGLNASGQGVVTDRDFDFVDLKNCPRSSNGIVAITIASE